jgi:hypothetical protein
MATPTPPSSTSPPSTGASWRSVWGQRLSWLISALSGTLDIEAEHRQKMNDYERENAKLDVMILRTKNENARLAEFDCVTLRERIQNRWIILQVQHQLVAREDTRAALADFIAFLQEYGE